MVRPSPRSRTSPEASPSPSDVDALLAALAHPRAATIEALRAVIRGVDPRIREGMKWNAPSYATTEHFATLHLRDRDSVQVILHLGAKPRPDAGVRAGVADPEGLLTWRGIDRATLTFRTPAEVAAHAAPLSAILRQWLTFVP